MARLFFALWPDEAAARALERLSHDLAIVAEGRIVAPEKIHLTLAFLGEVDGEGARRAHAVRPQAAPVAISLDCVGSFRGARVAWAGRLEPDAALQALQAGLAEQLRGHGFALEDRPFTPHVTLVRRTGRRVPRARIDPIGWTAREVTLVRSEGGGGYARLASWPLDDGGKPSGMGSGRG